MSIVATLWSTFADDQGRYAAYGKDRGGITQRMRADDGIHFTAPGYELIAEKLIELFPPPPILTGSYQRQKPSLFGILQQSAN